MVKVRLHSICKYCTNRPFFDVPTSCKRGYWCETRKFQPIAEIFANYPTGSDAKWGLGWSLTRQLVFLRQKGYCYRCKHYADSYEIHHLKHRQEHGTDHPRNLILLCETCHKATLSPKIEKEIIKQQIRQKNDTYWSKLQTKINVPSIDLQCEICGMDLYGNEPCKHNILAKCEQLIKQLES